METMSELEKNIIQPCLRTEATSALLCLFMVPIRWFPKFLKQTINCVTIRHFMHFRSRQEQEQEQEQHHQWLA
jgi:hypothetical protein